MTATTDARATASTKAPSKAAFVLGFGLETPVAEVVAKAAGVGLAISSNHVHAIRSQIRRERSKQRATKTAAKSVRVKQTPAPAKRKKKRKQKNAKTQIDVVKKPVPIAHRSVGASTPAPAKSMRGTSPEEVLAGLVIAHGIHKVREVLAAVEARVARLLSGK